MCISPITHNGTTFRCSKCWQCRSNKVQDWVGRCIAESRTSSDTMFVTLTYGGGDTPEAAILTYSHVQNYMKRMRWAGYRFKYLVAGEYGSRKGRAHWHVIFFFDGKMPVRDLMKNTQCEFWPHGHSWWEKADMKSFRYVCKYVVKDMDDQHAQSYIAMSRRPFVGRDYFGLLAQTHVDMGLSPQNLYYRFEESRDLNKKIVQHYMHGAVGRYFLAEYVERFAKKHGEYAHYPNSTLVDDYLDSLCDYIQPLQFEVRRYGLRPYFLPAGVETCEFSELHNTYISYVDDEPYFWLNRERDGSIGEHAWRSARGAIITRPEPGPSTETKRDQQQSRYEQLLQRLEQNTASFGRPLKRKPSTLPMVGELWTCRQLQYRDAMLDKFMLENPAPGNSPI